MRQFKGNFGLIVFVLIGCAALSIFINSSFMLQEELSMADELLWRAQDTKALIYKMRRDLPPPPPVPSASDDIK